MINDTFLGRRVGVGDKSHVGWLLFRKKGHEGNEDRLGKKAEIQALLGGQVYRTCWWTGCWREGKRIKEDFQDLP